MSTLQQANDKFARRFRTLNALARTRSLDLNNASFETLESLWDEVNAANRPGPRSRFSCLCRPLTTAQVDDVRRHPPSWPEPQFLKCVARLCVTLMDVRLTNTMEAAYTHCVLYGSRSREALREALDSVERLSGRHA
jgi:hypothetical protein